MASNDSPVPEGWWPIEGNGAKGKTVKYYTNELGQRFDTMEDLMRYVTYAKRAQLSIYAPDYVSSEAEKPKKVKSQKKKAKEEVADPSFQNDKKKAKQEVSDSGFQINKKDVEQEVSGASFQNDKITAEQEVLDASFQNDKKSAEQEVSDTKSQNDSKA